MQHFGRERAAFFPAAEILVLQLRVDKLVVGAAQFRQPACSRIDVVMAFYKRNYLSAQKIAAVSGVSVRGILAESNVFCGDISAYQRFIDAEQRAQHETFFFAHTCHSARPGSAQNVHQNAFGLVGGVMRKHDIIGFALIYNGAEYSATAYPRRAFDAYFVFCGEFRNVFVETQKCDAVFKAKFLDERGIVVEKTGPYNLLFLFSIGIDKTKAMGLLRGLTEFKRSYDLNLRIKNMLPDLYAEDPDFYRNMRIQDLAQGIHKLIRKHDLPGLMLRAFDTLPEMIMTPHQAWQRQIKGEVETIALEQLVGRVSANMILPYPPGVPLLMPGEMLTKEMTGSSLSEVASKYNLEEKQASDIEFNTLYIEGVGAEAKLIGAVTGAPENTVSKPVTGINGVYLFDVTSRTTLDNVTPESERVRLEANAESYISERLMQALMDQSDITDNRVKFF